MLGANCRFYPSCSDYAREAIERHGALQRHRGSRRAASVPLPPVSSGRLRPGSLTRVRLLARAHRFDGDVARMDTQRLILFVIFSFSALFLWEAWQREHAPPPPPVSAAKRRRRASRRDLPPTAGAVGGARRRAPAGRRARRRRRRAAAARRGPDGHDQDRPLHRRSRHGRRRDRAGRARQAPRRARHRPSPISRCSATPSARSSRRRACIGEGCPITARRTRCCPVRASSRRAPTRSSSSSQATAANGDKVVQMLTFHRGSYVIDVAFDVTNASSAPITPEAYFQLMRDTKQAVRAKLDGAGGVRRPGRLQRARTSSRRSNSARSTRKPPIRRASRRTRRAPTTAGSA